MIEKLFKILPHFAQNWMVTLYNVKAYRSRYSGKYKYFLERYKNNKGIALDDLKEIQRQKYKELVKYAMAKSPYYAKSLGRISCPEDIKNIRQLPIIDKETVRKNIEDIYTISEKEGIISKTGGTTGKSLTVRYTKNDIQERFAILDNFREESGYRLGKNTGWFSGKSLLTERDLKKRRYWKTDHLYKVRYYSTFHINQKSITFYLKNLVDYKPEYLVGFPSSMFEIAKYGLQNDFNFPRGIVKAIFPTAETITDEIRTTLEVFFKTKVYNQYASSEGAPFILECTEGNLHLEIQSGVFEVLDENDEPTENGRLVITSFTTYGTPLIRYDIGDTLVLDKSKAQIICKCGNNNPMIQSILGRISDHIVSPQTGKIGLGNISNCLKGIKNIVKFQIIQNSLENLVVLIVKDQEKYTHKEEKIFINNLRERVGEKMEISITYVEDIPVEASGKYRLVKNNLNQLF